MNRDPDGPQAENALFVQSLARGMSVLEAFRDADGALSLGQIATRTGLTRSAAQRLVHTFRTLSFSLIRMSRTFAENTVTMAASGASGMLWETWMKRCMKWRSISLGS